MARHEKRWQAGYRTMSRISQTLRCLLPLLLLHATISGCERGPVYLPVNGIVTLDGQPVAEAAISFYPLTPGGEPSTGVTDAQGKFTLKTAHDHAGALAGKHQISVFRADMVPLAPGEVPPPGDIALEGQRMKWIVPSKYSQFSTSGLEADVQPNMPSVELQLKSGV
jgi:predicted small lipoprotein YifL